MISNSVTAFRLALTPLIFLSLVMNGPNWIALWLFFAAGFLDVVDGKLARRLGEVSRFGAMLDLIGDRILTLAAVCGLISAGTLSVWASGFAAMLVARDLIFATLREMTPTPDALPSSPLEPFKIGFSFAGLGLAMLPPGAYPDPGIAQQSLAMALLAIAAALALTTVIQYWRAAASN